MANCFESLSLGGPDFQVLRDSVRNSLTESLNLFSGPKDLVLEIELMKLMDRMIGALLLKEHGVDRIFKLDGNLPVPMHNQRVFIVHANVMKVRQVADCINADITAGRKCRYKILMVPRKLYVCLRVLEQEGVYAYVTVDDLNFGLVPLDTDLLSLEMPEFFCSVFMENEYSSIHTVALSLLDLQTLFGVIPYIYGQGKVAQMVFKLMETLSKEQKSYSKLSDVGHLFIFDRDIDYVTTLLSQMTYQGMLDETFGIRTGYIEFGSQVTGSDKIGKVLLSSEDKIFAAIRDKHISSVCKILSDKAKELQLGQEKRQNMSLGEVKNFISQELKSVQQHHQSLALNISACEVVMEKRKMDFEEQLQFEHNLIENYSYQDSLKYLEEVIIRQFPILQTLRLICLLSLTCDGLASKDYSFLKTHFLQSYGYEHLITFFKLKNLGLFVEKDVKVALVNAGPGKLAGKVAAAMAALPRGSSFQTIKKKFDLTPNCDDSYSLQDPKDIGYVFNGAYIPLTCNFVKKMLDKDNTSSMEELGKLLPGNYFVHSRPRSSRGGSDPRSPEWSTKKVVLVYFLGGVTFAEIAAFRLLGRQTGYKFIIAATSTLNGNIMLENLIDETIQLQRAT